MTNVKVWDRTNNCGSFIGVYLDENNEVYSVSRVAHKESLELVKKVLDCNINLVAIVKIQKEEE